MFGKFWGLALAIVVGPCGVAPDAAGVAAEP